MKRYIRLKWGAVIFLSAMLVVGYSAIPMPGNEIFPFYSWTMFSMVPSEQVGFTVFIVEVNGKEINPPVEFRHSEGVLNGNIHSVVAYKDIQKLGFAYESGNKEEIQKWRKVFESNYLPPGVKYQLFRTKYDPITEWKSGDRSLELLQEWVANN